MRTRRGLRLALALAALPFGPAVALAVDEAPELVSPLAARGESRVDTLCPTLSWTHLEGARGYELVVYEVGQSGDQPQDAVADPVVRRNLPRGAATWTPTIDECLPRAGRYAWAVGARSENGEVLWSTSGLFRLVVPEQPSSPARHDSVATALDHASTPVARPTAPPGARTAFSAAAAPRPLTAEAFSPPTCTGSVFSDVSVSHPQCAWIEKLAADQIATQCAAGRYCPDNPVTRGQIAQLLERAIRGTDTWRPEAGDGALPNLPPALPTLTPLDATADSVGTFTSVTIGADGLALISYYDATNLDLKVAHCSDISCSSATVTSLDKALAVGTHTSITIGADGLGLISYYDATNGDLKVAHCSDIGCTFADITSLDTELSVGTYTSVTIGTDSLGLISYFDATMLELKVAHCSDPICSAATITSLDAASAGATAITIGGDGLGLISYFGDLLNNNLKVAHCSDLLCSAATITPSLDWVGDVGRHTSITIGDDGLGLISYFDATNFDLKVAHCSDVLCSAATITSLDTSNAVGTYTSITIGTDGLGLISYSDLLNVELKVAHCSNVLCTAATIARLDSAATAGSAIASTSITIGADGLGLISYFDATFEDLKVAHCSNVRCAPYFRRR